MKLNNVIKIAGVAGILVIGLAACSKKYPGDSYDFSKTDKKYLRMKAGQSIEINAEIVDTFVVDGGDTLAAYYYKQDEKDPEVLLETREGIPKALTVEIELQTPAVTRTIQGAVPAFSTAGKSVFTINEADFGGEDEVEGTLTLKSASGYDMALGYPTATSQVKVKFIAYKPNVIHLGDGGGS